MSASWFMPFLRLYIGTHKGAVNEAAADFGCSPAMVSSVLAGRKRVPESWLAKFYLQRVERYEPRAHP